jgi:hypothetical protein
LRKVALNISKDVKKFWMKIEKLVLYKHQMELDDKKKKALDKQLEFLLGQTERYSTMLAENLVDTCKPVQHYATQEQMTIKFKEVDEIDVNESPEFNFESQSNTADMDEDYDIRSEDESEDDEHTIEEDEALITEEERQEELTALRNEVDLPLEELLRRYDMEKVNGESSPEKSEDGSEPLSRESSSETDEDGAEPTIMGDDHGKGNKQLINHVIF